MVSPSLWEGGRGRVYIMQGAGSHKLCIGIVHFSRIFAGARHIHVIPIPSKRSEKQELTSFFCTCPLHQNNPLIVNPVHRQRIITFKNTPKPLILRSLQASHSCHLPVMFLSSTCHQLITDTFSSNY